MLYKMTVIFCLHFVDDFLVISINNLNNIIKMGVKDYFRFYNIKEILEYYGKYVFRGFVESTIVKSSIYS